MSQEEGRERRRAFEMLEEFLELEPEQRRSRLAELARAEPTLHERLEALLKADAEARARTFLSGGAAAELGRLERDHAADARLRGRSYGAWQLTEPLGAGGMGQVWLARRVDALYEGSAAIKLLGRGPLATSMAARFVREGEILGRLSHPNIARLLDAGIAEDGERYLVLEYVDGERIDAYCDRLGLSIEARIGLFRKVCEAVGHAHANLVVHRDLKPSNVMVTREGEVKLLDFGIAKLLEPDEARDVPQAEPRRELTEIVGAALTPDYAAPEQVLGEAVTTRTDVYALGVMLYVLLTGEHPYLDAQSVPARRLQAVLDTEPRRGSDSVPADAGRAAALARARGVTPRKLRELLRGDLDNILGRALRKSPAERYGSVQDLARDLERHLRHEPVEARPDSLGYRAGKFLRRHRVATLAAGLAALGLFGGLALALWQGGVAREQARLAQTEAAKATAVKEFLLDLFRAADINAPGGSARADTTLAQLLDIGQARMAAAALQDQPEVRSELLDQLGILYLQTQSPDKSEAMYRALHDLRLKEYGKADSRTIDAWVSVGTALRNQARYDEALVVYRDALAQLDAAALEAPAVRGRALLEIAYAMFRARPDDPAAIGIAERALALLRPLPESQQLFEAEYALARAYESARRFADAAAAYGAGLEVARRVMGPDSTPVAGGTQMRARALGLAGQLGRARQEMALAMEMFRERVGEEHRFFVDARQEYGDLAERFGDWRDVEPGVRAGLEFTERARGADHTLTVRARLMLARLLERSGDPATAYAEYARVATLTPLRERRPASVFVAELGRASAARERGDEAAARAALERARALRPALLTSLRDLPWEIAFLDARLALAEGDLAWWTRDAGSLAGAAAAVAAALDRAGASLPLDPEPRWRLRQLEARVVAGTDGGAAMVALGELIDEVRRHPEAAGYPHLLAALWSDLGAVAQRAGQPDAACEAFGQALSLRERLLRPGSQGLLRATSDLRACRPPQPVPTRRLSR